MPRNIEASRDASGVMDDGSIYLGNGVFILSVPLSLLDCPAGLRWDLINLARNAMGEKRNVLGVELNVRYRPIKNSGF